MSYREERGRVPYSFLAYLAAEVASQKRILQSSIDLVTFLITLFL